MYQKWPLFYGISTYFWNLPFELCFKNCCSFSSLLSFYNFYFLDWGKHLWSVIYSMMLLYQPLWEDLPPGRHPCLFFFEMSKQLNRRICCKCFIWNWQVPQPWFASLAESFIFADRYFNPVQDSVRHLIKYWLIWVVATLQRHRWNSHSGYLKPLGISVEKYTWSTIESIHISLLFLRFVSFFPSGRLEFWLSPNQHRFLA